LYQIRINLTTPPHYEDPASAGFFFGGFFSHTQTPVFFNKILYLTPQLRHKYRRSIVSGSCDSDPLFFFFGELQIGHAISIQSSPV
jgi:hypothetical protein